MGFKRAADWALPDLACSFFDLDRHTAFANYMNILDARWNPISYKACSNLPVEKDLMR
jgi:hypothetical protein